ncbi:hypothetical protein ACFX2J_008799 [Malus domestica]
MINKIKEFIHNTELLLSVTIYFSIVVVGPDSATEDIFDSHEKGEQRIGISHSIRVGSRDVGDEGPAWPLQRVVGDVEDPETDHEDGDGTGLGVLLKGVTGEVSKFSNVANEEDSCIKKTTIKKLSFFLNRQA